MKNNKIEKTLGELTFQLILSIITLFMLCYCVYLHNWLAVTTLFIGLLSGWVHED